MFGFNSDVSPYCTNHLNVFLQPNIDILEKKVDELCKKYQEARSKARGTSGNNTPNNDSSPHHQKTTGAHNAWGGFIR